MLLRSLELELVFIRGGIDLLIRRVRGQSRGRARGEVLRSSLVRLGPVPTKLGQILATRRDLLPGDVCDALAGLHDRVPVESVATGRVQLSRELGARAARVSLVSPLAGASVASVYIARLEDGTPVAVKLRRSRILPRMRTDFALLQLIAAAGERVPALSALPLRASITAVRKMVERQADFLGEAADIEILRIALDHADVTVPRVIHELVSSGCLVMELLSDLCPCSSASTLPLKTQRKLALNGLRALYQMIFNEGVIHADLHPGNVGWSPGPPPRLVVLDFGLVARLSPRDRVDFARFFLAMASGNGIVCADVILRTAAYLPARLDRNTFTADVSTVVMRHWTLDAASFNVGRFVAELFDVQRNHRVAGSVAFMTTIVALLAFEGTLRTLDPALDFQAAARRFFIEDAGADLMAGLFASSITSHRHSQSSGMDLRRSRSFG